MFYIYFILQIIMSHKHSPGPAPDIIHPAHSTKKNNGDSSPILSKLHKHTHHLTYFREQFEDVHQIGEGSFGEVFRARSKETGLYYAVKKSKERFRSDCDRRLKLEEVRKHELIPKHDNCVQFIGAWEEDDYLYIQLELCKTSLEEYTEVNHEITQDMLWDILLDVLLAVKHLHDHNLIHLDIKLENILVDLNGHYKLGDFGLVVDMSKEDFEDAVEGDPKYLAPELMTGHFTKAADIFSLGITMLELASDLDLPSQGPLWHELRNGIFPDDHIKHICPKMFELIRAMMTPDYVERPTVDFLLTHPHLTKMMMWRRRSHYVSQMVSQVQSLCSNWCAVLKSFMEIVLLPLAYLHSSTRSSCNSNGYVANGCVTNGTECSEWGNLCSDAENGEKSSMNQSCSSTSTCTTSPSFSPIRGDEQQTLFNTSVPYVMVTNSTPSSAPPGTPRKRNSDSLQDSITPVRTRIKRLCVSNTELHSYDQRSELETEVSTSCYHFSFSRTSTGARNLLPVFRNCKD
ncbi:membrane-associated tyrosine- and threonine-specific cdc2-inhibitory kinase isoform X2 [Zootermopsis nevadensis]|uniref:membrane-associated tyrosine- and threonine-specific cdc2-inhibitory kinase isoform X2 n=1 Tax=Zootermopsis nevadensis TaxID=136037 RepID=UPI000B8E3986|nr:membrane-associated tyrosine- and threonine-specific cdc2-inhibitory kinase isoform X2 [Zootermopsis nevadensis]